MTQSSSKLSEIGSLKKLTHRQIARHSIAYFAWYYLGIKLAKHQVEWLEFAEEGGWRHVEGPRVHGKSETCSFVYPIWLICNTRDARILFISETYTQAIKFLLRIKGELETNMRILRDYGDVTDRTRKWTENMLYCRRVTSHKDPTVEAVGVGGAIIGGHYKTIIADDILSADNQRTDDRRRKVEEWFWGTVLPLLEPDGDFIVIGTRKHYEDLYRKLIQDPRWKQKIYQAIIDEEKKVVLWQERWPYDKLIEMRESMGSLLFNRELQNTPAPPGGLRFKEEWLQYYKTPELALTDGEEFKRWLERYPRIAMAVDPAIGRELESSYSAIVTIGVTRDNQIYVLDMWRGHVSFDALLHTIIGKFDTWQPRELGIEAVFFQKVIPQALEKIRLLPLRELQPKKDKETRIDSLSVYFETGRIFLREDLQPITERFIEEEYKQFPEGAHNDLLDALAYAVQMAVGMEVGEREWVLF